MKELKKQKPGKIYLLLSVILLAGILYSCSRTSTGTDIRFESGKAEAQVWQDSGREPQDETAKAEEETDDREDVKDGERGEMTLAEVAKTGASQETEDSVEAQIWVHVCGQVAAPGVYSLKAGSRIFQALEAAGGVLEQGDGSILNLAMVLEDGMRIEVPARTETERLKAQGELPAQAFVISSGAGGIGASEKNASKGRKVNLNQADAQELMTLTGIGKSRAEAIIQYRQKVGPFRSIEDVMNVSGIKESAFEKIREDITV